jgi:hypothetical protein
VGLIPDEVTGFFNLTNPSSRTMALGSIQPLTDEYQESSWDKERPAGKADNFTAICEPTV